MLLPKLNEIVRLKNVWNRILTMRFCSRREKNIKVLQFPVGNSQLNPIELISFF